MVSELNCFIECSVNKFFDERKDHFLIARRSTAILEEYEKNEKKKHALDFLFLKKNNPLRLKVIDKRKTKVNPKKKKKETKDLYI